MIPSALTIAGFTIQTSNIFLVFALFIFAYVIWSEGKRDGFDEESIFDITIVSVIAGILFGRFIFALSSYTSLGGVLSHVISFWIYGIDYIAFFFSSLLVILLFSKLRKYSLYRMLDNFTLGGLLAVSVYLLAPVLIFNDYIMLIVVGVLLALYVLFYSFKTSNITSGLISSCTLIGVSSYMFIRNTNKNALIFLAFLFTLGIVILFKRLKSRSLTVSFKEQMKFNTQLPGEFINNVKNLLIRKEKELEKEEKLLSREDSEGVTNVVADSEFEDQGYAEGQHQTTNILKRSISEMRHQVKKALARINIGTYGLCEICHKPIDKARLKAFPQATTCMDCENKKNS